MSEIGAYFQDQTFDRCTQLTKGEYENCTFLNGQLSDSDLSEFTFIDCTFQHCNLSLAKLHKTSLQGVKFIDCKMLGLRFDSCNTFALSFSFDGCLLNHSSFYKTKIRKTLFKNSQLEDVDFAEADLTGVTFDNCHLNQAIFDHTILEKADLSSSYHYSLDPEINRIKKAKFSISGLPGLLGKYDIEVDK